METIYNRSLLEKTPSPFLDVASEYQELVRRVTQILGRESLNLQNYWYCGLCLCPRNLEENLDSKVSEILQNFPLEQVFHLRNSLDQNIQDLQNKIRQQSLFIDELNNTNHDKMKNTMQIISSISIQLENNYNYENLEELSEIIHRSAQDFLSLLLQNLDSYESVKDRLPLTPNPVEILRHLQHLSENLEQAVAMLEATVVSPSLYCRCCCCLFPKSTAHAMIIPNTSIYEQLKQRTLSPIIEQEKQMTELIMQIEEKNGNIANLMSKNTPGIRAALEKVSFYSSKEAGASMQQAQSLLHASNELLTLFHKEGSTMPVFRKIFPNMTEALEILKDRKILVVDDSPTIRKVMENLLKKNNMIVETASDGQQAIDRLNLTNIPEVCDFDLLLMDLNMPVIDGLEAARQIRTRWTSPVLPILILSGEEPSQAELKARKAGVDGFLEKPHTKESLFPLMAQLILERR